MSQPLLVQTIARALRQRCEVHQGDHLLLAVSGGSDSVALLRALEPLSSQRRWRLRLTVGHVHHHLRGHDADTDAAFVRRLAQQWKLAYLEQDIYPGRQPGNVEAHARRLRYQALVQMARTSQASTIVTAHHGDDQMETLLMRALRGASAKGLRGIAWQRELADGVRVIRPMLLADRLMVRDYLAQVHQSCREDPTNGDVSRTRAKLRQDVLPTLRAMTKGSPARRAQSFGDHMHDLHQLLDEQVQQVEQTLTQGALSRRQARTLNRAVLMGVLRHMAIAAGARPDRTGQRALSRLAQAAVDAVGGQRTFELSGQVTAVVTREQVHMFVNQSP